MIDPLTERLVSLSDAAKLVPVRRRGKPAHLSCIYRWTTSGCRGVVLESIQIGGTRCTSKEALARFFAKLSGQSQGSPQPAGDRQRQIETAEAACDRAGI